MTKSPSLQAQEDCDQDYSKLVLLALDVFTHAGKVISELRKLCRAVHTVFLVSRNAFARARTKLRGNSSSSERRVTDKNCASVFEFQKKSSLGSAFALPLIVLTAPAFSNSRRWALKSISPISSTAAIMAPASLRRCWERRRGGLGMR